METEQMKLIAGLDQSWAVSVQAWNDAPPATREELTRVLGSKSTGHDLIAWIGTNEKKAKLVKQLAFIAVGETIRRLGDKLNAELAELDGK